MEKHPDLVVLGFPCNQFGKQEPGANATEILNGIRYVRPGNNFETKVTQFFQKVDVNGFFQIPLYKYLKGSCGTTFTKFASSERLFYDPFEINDIAWNFEKFLIGRDGKPMYRYHPKLTDPEHVDMLGDLSSALSAANPFAPETETSPPPPRSLEQMLSSPQFPTQKAKLMGRIKINEPGQN